MWLRASASDAVGCTVGGCSRQLDIDRRHLQSLERAVGADEVGHHRRRRIAEHLGGRVVLGQDAADVEDRDAVAHLDRLLDVVGDEHDRLAHLVLEAQELVLEPHSGDGVDGAEGLVHEQHGRVGCQRPSDADALALPARELGRIAAAVVAGSSPTRSRSSSTRVGDAGRGPSRAGGAPFPTFVRDGLVGEQPDLLDHVPDAAAQRDRVDVGDVVAVEEDAAARRLDEAVDHLQRRRLAASRRADEHADLAFRDLERQVA